MFLQKNGVFGFEAEGFSISQWGLSLEIDGEIIHIPCDSICLEGTQPKTMRYDLPGRGVEWEIRLEDNGCEVVVDSTLYNRGSKAVRLGKAVLLETQTVTYGEPEDDVVVLSWHRQSWGMLEVYSVKDKDVPKLSKVKTQFYNRTGKRAVQVGFLSFQRANTEVVLDSSDERGLYSLKAYCDFAGWELAGGASTGTETLRVVVGKDPHEQMEDWAGAAAQRCKPQIWKDTPIGYLGWSWVDCVHGETNYEEVALEMLDAINQRLGGLGVRYLWTSMNNVEGSLPGNWLKWNKRSIPSGREVFIQRVYEKGFLPGLWVGPFYFCSMLRELMEYFKDAILQTVDGKPMVVCEKWGHGDAGLLPIDERPCLYALDPSHPKVLAFIREVFETYRAWGIRYYMVDFLEAGAGNLHRFPYKESYDKSLVAGPEVYCQFLRMMKEAAGRDAYMLSSTGPWLHHAGILDGVRTGNDFGEGRELSPGAFFFPATYVINTVSFWTGPRYALTNQAAHYHTHRKLYLNDSANVLTVDKPIPLSHARIAAAIHAFSGGPSMLGDDIRVIDEERLNLIKKTLPRSTAVGKPVDLFECDRQTGPRLFHRHIDKPWGTFEVIAVYNLTSESMVMTVDLDKLGLDCSQAYLVWDFWNEGMYARAKGELEIRVAPESVKILRLTAAVHEPTLVGTDMHIMMGEMEISEFTYDAASMICRVTANRPEGNTGMVFVHTPDDVYVKNFDGLHIAKDGRDNTLIIGVPMRFGASGSVSREIRFGKLQEALDMNKLNLA